MKRIINAKRYDTETARKVATWSNGLSVRDFCYITEDLYVKKTGEYFLHGKGGANTRYAESCGRNCWCEGEEIVPLTDLDARAWVEQHCNTQYENIFGECQE